MMRNLMILAAMMAAPKVGYAGNTHIEIQSHWEVYGSSKDEKRKKEDHSSRANRRGKTLSLLWGTDGFTAGLYATPDLVFEGSYAAFDYSDGEDGRDDGPEWFQYGLGLKSFHGNSFYTRWAVEHRQINMAAYIDDYVGVQAATNGVFGVGNQWQWDYFTLGIRWVQATVPMMTKVRTLSTAPGKKTVSPMTPDRTKPWLDYLNVQIGVSF